MDVERDVTVLVKTFERPDCLRRLVASIGRYYPRIAIVVVDDSGQRLDPVPSEIATYFHEPYNSEDSANGVTFVPDVAAGTYSVTVTCGNAFVGEASFDVTG